MDWECQIRKNNIMFQFFYLKKFSKENVFINSNLINKDKHSEKNPMKTQCFDILK